MAFRSTIYGSTFPDTRELKELQMENLSPEDLGSNVKAFLGYAISDPGHKRICGSYPCLPNVQFRYQQTKQRVQ
jgi:hypothetical protein